MRVEEFSSDLTLYVRRLVDDGATPGWEKALDAKIRELADKFQFRLRTPSFTLGDADSPTTELPKGTALTNGDHYAPIANSVTSSPTPPAAADEPFSESERRVWQRLRIGSLNPRELEREFDQTRPDEAIKSVRLRRRFIDENMNMDVADLPYDHYNYSLLKVYGACCENVFGYVPLPTGLVGPLRMNGADVYVPLATTEGALIASANRGCKALNMCGGVEVFVEKDGMTRAPVLKFADSTELRRCVNWLQSADTFHAVKTMFESESRFCRLQRYELTIDERHLFVRFVASTGDAMGMNMVTKCCYKALNVITDKFPSAKVVSISGNMCVDKKASRVNWERGRGKSVTASAMLSAAVIKQIFRVSVDELVDLAYAKFELGARHAGCIGGANAHAANVVAAIFLATGQDAAQVVSSSMCATELRKTDAGDLRMSCRMPCLEVGTVGGGTILPAQQTCLKMLGCCGGHSSEPGENAKRLARVICSTVLAGELSLMASQCAGDLMTGHIKLNRSNVNLSSSPSLRPLATDRKAPMMRFTSEVDLNGSARRSAAAQTRRLPPAGDRTPPPAASEMTANPNGKNTGVAKEADHDDDDDGEDELTELCEKAVSPSVIIITGKLGKKVAARCDHLL